MIIDHDIPIPNDGSNGRPRAYPFQDMEVGDSVLFSMRGARAVGAAHNYGWKTGKKFKSRTIDGQVRIWRVR